MTSEHPGELLQLSRQRSSFRRIPVERRLELLEAKDVVEDPRVAGGRARRARVLCERGRDATRSDGPAAEQRRALEHRGSRDRTEATARMRGIVPYESVKRNRLRTERDLLARSGCTQTVADLMSPTERVS